jgi:hypothetical protein
VVEGVLGLRQGYRACFDGQTVTVEFGVGWAYWRVVFAGVLASWQGYRVSPNGFRHRVSSVVCAVDDVFGLRQGYRGGL